MVTKQDEREEESRAAARTALHVDDLIDDRALTSEDDDEFNLRVRLNVDA